MANFSARHKFRIKNSFPKASQAVEHSQALPYLFPTEFVDTPKQLQNLLSPRRKENHAKKRIYRPSVGFLHQAYLKSSVEDQGSL